MAVPLGAKPHKLDAAGRLKLRDDERGLFDSAVVVSCGFDNCISLFDPAQWERFVGDFQELAEQDPQAHDLRRLLVATAERCEIDAQGRIKLPEFLLRWADLGGGKLEAVLIQVGPGRWECWEEEHYRTFLTQRAQELKQIATSYWRTDTERAGEGDGSG